MHIALSLLAFRPGQVGGAETYIRQLLTYFPEFLEGDRCTVLLDRDLARQLETPGLDRHVVDRSARGILIERVLEAFTPYRARAVEAALASLDPDVVFFPQQSIFPKRMAAPAVVTVHDLQHLYLPENFSLLDRAFRSAVYGPSARSAEKVLAISETTRLSVLEKMAVAPDRVVTVLSGVPEINAADIPPTTLTDAPYFYYPAATFAHKNHRALIDSFTVLHRSGKIRGRLVFSGHRTSVWPPLEKQIHALGMQDQILHLGHLPFDEVLRLYAGCEAVLFPSLFEGFGLPVVEATVFQKTVVVSRLPIYKELGVPERFQIDFTDPDALGRCIARNSPEARAAEPFGPTVLENSLPTWPESAKETLAQLRNAARGDREPPAASRAERPDRRPDI